MSLQAFLTESTVHGVSYLKSKNKWNRRIWAGIIFVSLSLCAWQTAVNVRDYLAFNVVTANTYKIKDNLSFPAITFWNKNLFRRTVIGRSSEYEFLYTLIMKSAKNIAFSDVRKTCDMPGHQRDEIDEQLDQLAARFSPTGKDRNQIMSLTQDVHSLLTVTKEMTFVKCWYQQTKFNCTSKVQTTIVEDDGGPAPMYSVNIDPGVINALFDGTNFTGNKDYNDDQGEIGKQQSGVGNKNGYRFVLNVNAEDYCKTRRDRWYGVGLHATFHDREMIFIEPNQQSTIFLQPGFEYDVLLQPKVYTRKTEHIGKCLKQYRSYMRPTSTKYLKAICQMECLADIVWKKCGCFCWNINAYHELFAKHHGLRVKDVPLTCWLNNTATACFDGVKVKGGLKLTSTMELLCSWCIQPCDETVYNFVITAKKFSPRHLKQFYQKELNLTNDTSVDKTILVLNVFFGSNWANVFEDTQMYTIRELFIYIGNNIGLFLGMSFMSWNEVWYYPICGILTNRKKFVNVVKKGFRAIVKSLKRIGRIWFRSTKVHTIKPQTGRRQRARMSQVTTV